MTDAVAATPTGAESAPQAAPTQEAARPLSIHERIKASFATEVPRETSEAQVAPRLGEIDAPKPAEKPAAPKVEPADVDPAEIETEQEDAQDEPLPSKLTELAERTGLELDALMDLEVATKIDGKEGSAKLRDLIKSHQLEGHLNQKLMTFAEEKKGFEVETVRKQQETQQQFMNLNAATQVAQRLLDGEMAGIDWQALQQADPVEFNKHYVGFQQRQAQINQVAQMIGQERQQAEQQAASQKQAYRAEQSKLLDSKLPEWSDKAVRTKAIAEMATVLNDAYGVTEKELKNETDHRLILIARDAARWQQLQKSKPALLNKVTTAPKLLKPGTPQSRATQDELRFKSDRDRAKATGKVKDAARVLRHLM